ncbi:NAD(P)-dependent dehydrogenase (short-subunit alcohol dehydrogenase family) [Okibacterium sp. HSC-33S16]|uniref:SDR family NAD(P)-dependent oxidoreductase n=1 Tax=Okibacterium sp. HSC-33S16 TaxID=2910965 RepID=UPI00209CAB60|nr:SDR family NAD(P)-dependent oxidoreductase [Okibacterium sp. HSC-33S16]MCP2031382.1 NAD(P)-dependent dehydrogenase (short-subunit alcohol dehydrogenase family) [Okibacterium sp. HSC-33S16]
MTDISGKLVLVAGATSAAGIAVCRELASAGARVIAVGSHDERMRDLVETVPDATGMICNLAHLDEVARLGDRVHEDHGRIDGLIHLVGGWRGGGGLAGQSDEDWDFLHSRIVTTLRNTTRVFVDDLQASDAGRLALVSTTTLDRPMPGGANYAAAKAAAETWARAIANGFEKSAASASVTVFAVRALAGLETQLATEVTRLWEADAASAFFMRSILTAPEGS